MKLQAIKKCCNAYGTYAIINCPDGQQWLGCGAACWPVEGIFIKAEAVPAIFDIPAKKKDEMNIREDEWTDPRFQIIQTADEALLEDVGNILHNGTIYKVLDGPEGVLLIDNDLVKPAERGKYDLRYTIRPMKGRTPLVAVYADMFVNGIVMPIAPESAHKILERMGRIAGMRVRGYMKPKEDEPEGEQMSMEGGAEA